MVAVALPAVIAGAGLAVDLGQIYVARSKLQNAVDAAALAGSMQLPYDPDVSNGTVAEAATTLLTTNDPSAETLSIAAGGQTRSVCVEAASKVDMTLMKVVGINQETVTASACAGFNNLEIALVLDTTGSMKGTPIDNVKSAATDMVKLVMPEGGAPSSKVALVPFQGKVRIDGNDPVQPDPDGVGVGCRNANGTLNNGRLKTEYTKSPFTGYSISSSVSTSQDKTCSGMSPVRGLSTDRSAILNTISSLKAGAVTSGTLISEGIKWGRKVLTSPYGEASTDKKYRKIMIVLTDGDTEDGRCGGTYKSQSNTIDTYWTNAYFGEGLKPTTTTSDYTKQSTASATLAAIPSCVDGGGLNNAMKAEADKAKAPEAGREQAIEVFAIRYGDSDSTDKSLMQYIATDAEHYYNAPSESEIKDIFKKIGQQLGLRLMSKAEATGSAN